MSMPDLKKLLRETKKITRSIGKYIVLEFNNFKFSRIETKSNLNDLVSYVDRETEKKLSEQLLKLLPNSSILGEENTQSNLINEYTWIIDPIDGTTNFVHGIPLFCISIGLLYENQIILGLVYNPISKEMFYAIKGGPSMLNGKVIQCSENQELSKSLIAVGLSIIGKVTKFQKNQKWFFTKFPKLFSKARGVRGIGSAALSLCWVAAGRFDIYCEKGLNVWDVAGGSLIVKQAGGKVTDFNNLDNFLFSGELLATGKVYPKVYKFLKKP